MTHGSQIESHLQFRYSTAYEFRNFFNHFLSRFHFDGHKFVFTNEDKLATCQSDIKCHITCHILAPMIWQNTPKFDTCGYTRTLDNQFGPEAFSSLHFLATQTETNILSSPRTLHSAHFDGDFIMLNEIRYLASVSIRQYVCVFVSYILLKHIFFFLVMYANSICSICLAAMASTATLRDKWI